MTANVIRMKRAKVVRPTAAFAKAALSAVTASWKALNPVIRIPKAVPRRKVMLVPKHATPNVRVSALAVPANSAGMGSSTVLKAAIQLPKNVLQ